MLEMLEMVEPVERNERNQSGARAVVHTISKAPGLQAVVCSCLTTALLMVPLACSDDSDTGTPSISTSSSVLTGAEPTTTSMSMSATVSSTAETAGTGETLNTTGTTGTTDGTATTDQAATTTGNPLTGAGATDGISSTEGGTTGEDSATGSAVCGDGIVSPGEQCDGLNLQGFTCATLGLGMGILTCDPFTCSFDWTMCESFPGMTEG